MSIAGIISMIPVELVLFTSLALTGGAITLNKKKVIVKKINGTENLTCIDVLCLGKTVTITNNTLIVVNYINTNYKC